MQRIGTGLEMNMLCTFNTEDTSLFEGGRYSVLLEDQNSFCGDVVLDSVNMASRDRE